MKMMTMMKTNLLSLTLLLLTSSWIGTSDAAFAPPRIVKGVPTHSRLLSIIGSDKELEAAKRVQKTKAAEQKKAAILKDAAVYRKMINTDQYQDIVQDLKASILNYKEDVIAKDTQDVITQDDKEDEGTDRRRLQEECEDLLLVLGGNCTIQEYCQVLDANITEADITCTGDFNTGWSQITSTEACVYLSQAGLFGIFLPSPYEEESFDPEVDFCYAFSITIEYDSFDPLGQTEAFSITRGGSGSYAKTSVNVPCNITDPESDICSECEEASFNGVPCTSCTNCPDDFMGPDTALVCDNVIPDFVQTCEDDDDQVFLTLFTESGVLCTFQGWLDGTCSSEAFCGILEAVSFNPFFEDAAPAIECNLDGSPDGDWTLSLAYGENCWYNSTGGGEGVYNETTIDLSEDYCYTELEKIAGNGAEVTSADYVFTITKPCEIALTASFPIISCDDGVQQLRKLQETYYDDEYVDDGYDDDDIFFPAYCTDEGACGEITIGGRECTSGCKTCPDGSLLGTCFNLADDLEETCGSDFPDTQVDYAIIAYCLANPPPEPTAEPTSSPVTDSPTMMPSNAATTTTDRNSAAPGIVTHLATTLVFALGAVVAILA
eukprot:scaffold3221_cov194-Amphora_coffeaeformis.AAC.4